MRRKKLLNKPHQISARTPSSGINKKLMIYVLSISLIGLIAVADASAPLAVRQFGDKFFFIKQQLFAFGIGLTLMLLLSQINYKIWEKLALPIFLLSIVLLVLVLIPGFGNKLLGARRWLVLGPVNFQPSELAKLALCIYIAKVASANKKPLAYFLPLLLVAGLVMLQPDLGTTIVLVGIGIIQMFASGVNLFYFIGFVLFSMLSSFTLIMTSDYRRQRLMSFINHAANDEPSYHIKQAILAIGSGGLFGAGLGQSKQKFLFVPESASDSIFAIIAEELGFIRSCALILFLLIFVLVGLRSANSVQDRFGRIMAIGIVSWIGLQIILNLFSMLAITPITGVPLPFISYGGTSLVTLMVATGILLNITRGKN